MGYASLKECVDDLERHNMLIRVHAEVDPYLEIAEIQRRLYAIQGPAVLFERVKGSPFPAVANLYGTLDRTRFMFRDTLRTIELLMRAKANPAAALRKPWQFAGVPWLAWKALPRKKRSGPVQFGETTIDQLPQIVSWPKDGGPYILLPQVCTEDPDAPGIMKTNVGMYRVQLGGNQYIPNQEIGLHYQIHRGIGVHHARALRKDQPLKVTIFVGGPPSHAFSAVMPLPEGLSEVMFAGMLGNRRFRYTRHDGHLLSTDADFCITGTITNVTKPEGPFGDHLGYYSLQHEYPVMRVEKVFHRKDAIWPFTIVGRPPQEDTTFGQMIHEITGPVVPSEIPGLHAMHAVDAAGVHPLLLAVGSERYVPYGDRIPQELLTISNAILGFGQVSLAKYLLIAAGEDNPPPIHDEGAFICHVLERMDFKRDLHFQTCTTIDTLDYSGTGYNAGSKVVFAAAGQVKRTLTTAVPNLRLPDGFSGPALAMPGVLTLAGPPHEGPASETDIRKLCAALEGQVTDGIALIVVCDDAAFTAKSLHNFLWVTFTRSNPSHDLDGVGAFTDHKHWGCTGPLVIDARIKPHHAPSLVEDPEVTRRVDALALADGPFAGMW